MMNRIEATGDLRLVGLLLDACGNMSAVMFRESLLWILPRLKASDAALLNRRQRAVLHRSILPHRRWRLFGSYNKDLVLAILKALEQIGDKEAVTHVQKLIEMTKDPEIREAAKTCLPFLEERARQTEVSQTLLRPSDAESAMPETLLRPAEGGPDANPQELLRLDSSPILLTLPIQEEASQTHQVGARRGD